MPSSCLSLYTLTPTPTITRLSKCPKFKYVPCRRVMIRACSSSSSGNNVSDFDLYGLLGVESSSEQREIKSAYRSLQKRCHPDIAGPAGHDMAIILNEAYALLSNPSSRSAYDKEQEKTAQLRGYTGKPIYSVWFGPESENRAVFVDEVKCVGCLKCALFAEKTFAIESVYGRARVVAQWADPEHKIQEAIGACPVDCISFVERSDLAALEFLMSKQPRESVRVGGSNTAGARVSNIFTEVRKFHVRYQEATEKASGQNSKETDLQRAARMSAVQAIRSISNWMYWQAPNSGGSTANPHHYLTKTARKSTAQPDIGKLREAVAARKKIMNRSSTKNNLFHEDYWIRSTHALPSGSTETGSDPRTRPEPSPTKESKRTEDVDYTFSRRNRRNNTSPVIPLGMGMAAALVVRLHGEGPVGRVDEHIGGSLALWIVNSSWLPVLLTGITWYIIGILAVGFVEAIKSRES